MSSCRSTSSSATSSSRSSPDLPTATHYRTTIDGQITAFKMWRVDNRAEMERRYPEYVHRPDVMYSREKGFWRYHVSQEEKDHYYEMEAEIRAGGGVAQKPHGKIKMDPISEVYEEPVSENMELMEPIEDSKPQDHIKRPMNAFIIWGQEERKLITRRNPKMTAPEISRRLGEAWKKMSDREKKPFFEQAEKLKKQHQQMYPGYKFQPRKLMAHLESMNRRRGRSFNPIHRPPSVSAKSSESTRTSESSSMTPILDAMLAQPLMMAQNLNPEPESGYQYHLQNENWDPAPIEYEPTGLATMKQRCDLHLLPSRYLCPESDDNFSIYANIPMALGNADLPMFY